MTTEPDLERNDVERFYARQRREILDRIARGRRAGHSAPPARGVGGVALAAAAMLAIAALGVLLFPVSTSRRGAVRGNASETLVLPASLPLPAFGAWSDEEMLEESVDPEIGTVDWLLASGTWVASTGKLPGFLEPFGLWPEDGDTASESGSA